MPLHASTFKFLRDKFRLQGMSAEFTSFENGRTKVWAGQATLKASVACLGFAHCWLLVACCLQSVEVLKLMTSEYIIPASTGRLDAFAFVGGVESYFNVPQREQQWTC